MPSSTANITIQNNLEGYERTGEHRVPRAGELYELPYGPHAPSKVMRSGGRVGVKFDILRKKVSPFISAEFVDRPDHRDYQIKVARRGEPGVYLTEGEAEELIDQLEDAIEAAEESRTSYVQVTYNGPTSARYTYLDPSGTLEVGDLVEVPVTYGTKPGEVVALGKGSWTGPVKEVVARLTRESL